MGGSNMDCVLNNCDVPSVLGFLCEALRTIGSGTSMLALS